MAPLRLNCLLLMLFMVSCEGCKDDPEPVPEIQKLPTATQNGAQTFGCLIDGKASVAKGPYFLFGMYQEGILSISATEKYTGKNIDRVIRIDLSENDLQVGTYELTELPQGRAGVSDVVLKCYHETSSQSVGSLIITRFDPSQLILSGTFEFEGYSPDCNTVVKVTDGRFDLVYAP